MKGKFLCGICLAGSVSQYKEECDVWKARAEKAEKALERLEKSVEKLMKKEEKIEEKRKEDRKAYAEKLKENMEERMNLAQENLEHKRIVAQECLKEDLSKEVVMEVKRKQMEEMRKKRLMVFGLQKGPEKDEEVVRRMVVRLTSDVVKPVMVERLREKVDAGGKCRPVIVEFRSEAEKWKVLERKAELKDEKEFSKFFLELDLPQEVRAMEKEKRMTRIREKKKREAEAKKAQEELRKESERERQEEEGE